jgi:DNA-binding transcriptional LysR family regulator
MLDVRRMRVLREVALRGSIAAAAEALSFTPSAVSQQLAQLERESGVALLHRGPRSVRLTDAGRVLVAHTEAILARLASAEAEIRSLTAEQAGTIRLGSFPTAAATLVPPALGAMGRRCPEVAVTLREADPGLALGELVSGELDLALLWEYDYVPVVVPGSIECVPLLEDPVRVVLASDHPAARGETVALADLADEPWISSTPLSSCHPFTRRACNAAGFEPRVTAETNDHHVLARLVASGVGVALVSELSLGGMGEDVAVRPIAPNPPKRRILAAHRAAESAASPVAAMVEELRAAAAAYAGAERSVTERPAGRSSSRSRL